MDELDENYKIILSVSQRLRCGPGGIAFVCVRLIHITKKNRQTAIPGVAGFPQKQYIPNKSLAKIIYIHPLYKLLKKERTAKNIVALSFFFLNSN